MKRNEEKKESGRYVEVFVLAWNPVCQLVIVAAVFTLMNVAEEMLMDKLRCSNRNVTMQRRFMEPLEPSLSTRHCCRSIQFDERCRRYVDG